MQNKWALEALREAYAEERLKVGEDDEGYPVRLKLKYFLYYLFDAAVHQRDDAPLYLFDSTFGEDERKTRSLLDDFDVPLHFAEDLFQYAGERRRPPYRWLVVGGPRSGTWCHVDPLATSAWNTVLSGSKRWVLLPPETPIGTSLDLMAASARMTTTPRVGGGGGGAMTGGALPSWSTGGGGGGGGIGGLFAEAAMSGAGGGPPPFPKGSPFDKLAERWTAASGMKRGPAYE